jgi:hypothetical protein
MAIEPVPAQFRTSDGMKWDTRREAERHEALIEAQREYEAARRNYGARLAEDQRTADGEPFTFGWHEYWWLHPGHSLTPPGLRKVTFSEYGLGFTLDEDRLCIYSEHGGDRRQYRIGELYWHQYEAKLALLTALTAWLAERQTELKMLRAELGENADEGL